MAITIHNPERFKHKPNAVLFDLDNTLYAYEPAHEKAMDICKEKANQLLGVTTEQFEEAFTKAKKEIKQRLGHTASSHSRLLYFQRMIELLGMKSQVLFALDLEQTYWRSFLSTTELFEDVIDFLNDLKAAGIPTAVVTDLGVQIQFRKIIYFRLEEYFDFVVTSDEAGIDKPSAVPFLLAIEKLKIDPTQAWMIGEDYEKDILGAKKAINCITLQKYHKGVALTESPDKPDAVFKHFSAVRKLLEGLE